MGALISAFTGGGSDPSQLLAEEQAIFDSNFALETHASEQQNTEQTYTAIGTNENQSLASSQAGESQVGQKNAQIVA